MNKIVPKNLMAQITYTARGNPPAAGPSSAISNSFPGLEFDFRNIWKHFLLGVEFHEGSTDVIRVEPGSDAETAGVTTLHSLVSIGNFPVRGDEIINEGPTSVSGSLEWSNALVEVLHGTDRKPECRFERFSGDGLSLGSAVIVRMELRPLFDKIEIPENIAEPGALTQSLCSPWQADFRECGCYYWAASRPDFVNVELDETGNVTSGINWMDKDRNRGTYLPDSGDDSDQITYEDLYRNWEELLRFQIGGKDE